MKVFRRTVLLIRRDLEIATLSGCRPCIVLHKNKQSVRSFTFKPYNVKYPQHFSRLLVMIFSIKPLSTTPHQNRYYRQNFTAENINILFPDFKASYERFTKMAQHYLNKIFLSLTNLLQPHLHINIW